jgi:hypothetical protein
VQADDHAHVDDHAEVDEIDPELAQAVSIRDTRTSSVVVASRTGRLLAETWPRSAW